MARETKNVFISHVHEDDAGLTALKSLLAKHGMGIRDSSINSSNPNNAKSPEYIRNSVLAPQIRWAGVLLVYVSPKTKNSEWVNWEIEYAQRHDKRIVGVWANGAKDTDLPEALERYGDTVVGWDGKNIVDAINGRDLNWQKPDKTPRLPRQIRRYSCS